MALDLKIVGGTLVLDGETVRAGLDISNGRIVQIAADDYLPDAAESIDASRRHVLPGAVDSHVHSRDPGYPNDVETTILRGETVFRGDEVVGRPGGRLVAAVTTIGWFGTREG